MTHTRILALITNVMFMAFNAVLFGLLVMWYTDDPAMRFKRDFQPPCVEAGFTPAQCTFLATLSRSRRPL